MFDLRGKRVLLTGATGGIGSVAARMLHGQGAILTLTGSREEALNHLASSLGDRCFVQTINLKDGNVDGLVKQAEETMGGIDILINNAGLTRDGLILRMKDGDFDDVIQVNLTAAFRLIRGVLKGMLKQRHGRIINITSVVGVTGNPGQANYCASKAGMIGMTKAIAAEVAMRGITANCIAPGFIESPMTAGLTDDQKARITQTIPMGRMGTPEDIGAAIVYLASTEGAYMTGQTLHINGGMAMI